MARYVWSFFPVHRRNQRNFLIFLLVQALVSLMRPGNSKIANFYCVNESSLHFFRGWKRVLFGVKTKVLFSFSYVLILTVWISNRHWLHNLCSVIEGRQGTIIGQSLPEVLWVDCILIYLSEGSSCIFVIFFNDWDQWLVGIFQDWAEMINKRLRSLAEGILQCATHHLVLLMRFWWLFLLRTILRVLFWSIDYLVSIRIEGLVASIWMTCGRILLLLLLKSQCCLSGEVSILLNLLEDLIACLHL